MTLFCFPYAGGSAAIYSKWNKYINPEIEVKPIELAGRGRRISEPHYHFFSSAIDDVFSIIEPEIHNKEYAFFGHSMGSKMAYELALRIKKLRLPLPNHIFFSGSGAPYTIRSDEKDYSVLSDEDFRTEVLNLGGTPKEFFDSPELLEVFLPLLRSDFRLAKRERGKEPVSLPLNITVFLGKTDDLTSDQITEWKNYSTGECTLHYFDGGHFFINEKCPEIIQKIEATLLKNVRRQSRISTS